MARQALAGNGFIFVENCAGPFLVGLRALLISSVIVLISVSITTASRTLAAFGLLTLLAAPAQAQRKGRAAAPANADGSLGTAPGVGKPARLLPLFGNLSPTQASQVLGETKLKAIAASFASTAEASAFFTRTGFEYLRENQPDTAVYRFNLAWLLNPQNAEAYRGLGVVASTQPTPDAAIALLTKGLTLAPTDALLMSDLGTSYLIRYSQTKKKKDLTAGMGLLQRVVATDATNAAAWQQLARGLYYQEKYAEAWDAVHKGQTQSVSSLDFGLISDLLAKLPDPRGTFK